MENEYFTAVELAYIPILTLLLVNLSSGTRAKGSSNDRIICQTALEVSSTVKVNSYEYKTYLFYFLFHFSYVKDNL